MKILLDSHILLWSLTEPEKLDSKKLAFIRDLSNILYISAVSIAEISIKASIGKLKIEGEFLENIEKAGFEFMAFSAEEAAMLRELPRHHKDLFDRMLICQSIVNKYPILTDDDKFSRYDCDFLYGWLLNMTSYIRQNEQSAVSGGRQFHVGAPGIRVERLISLRFLKLSRALFSIASRSK